MIRMLKIFFGLFICMQGTQLASAEEKRHTAYTTAYSIFDNTPPRSKAIAFPKKRGYPTIHDEAGGTGTYEDPITIAVGHVIEDGVSTPDFAPGTIFYIPNVRRYFIVEDVCGDGSTPQNGPCHTFDDGSQYAVFAGAEIWLDMWIDGENGDEETVSRCASTLTDENEHYDVTHLVIENPASTYAVVPGALFQDGTCAKQYGDELVWK